LKREIRDLDRKMDLAARETISRQSDVARLEEIVREHEARKAGLVLGLQEIEKAILNMDHRVRELMADYDRAEQRRRVARAEIERFDQERFGIEESMVDAERELMEIAAQKAQIENEIRERVGQSERLRLDGENLRHELSESQSRLAVLDERRSTVVREIHQLTAQANDLDERAKRAEQQIRQADEQQDQTQAMIRNLEEAKFEFEREKETLDSSIAASAAQLESLRHELHDSETRWDETRALLDSWKDRHNALEIEKTQVESDLKHVSSLCFSELNETIESICLTYFFPLSQEELDLREQEYRELRERVEAMGAVNMMAVEEHQEAEDRFQFLTTQRQDLLDSIRDTMQAIEEIDSVCRRQFKDAFEAINAGFKEAFISLFGGGHGELRLMEEVAEADAGVEIVAQPPGKKLQNVLLLSGGEKALTALSLLIALFRYKPSPFCVLDEVDAPLDDANVDRFAQMVRTMSETTQFIVITHSKRTMETASALYGVTMEEPGISKIVSVRLN
jgi:chromosome segregation protein